MNPSCAKCKFVVYNPYTPPLCSRIMMRPGNSYVPCYYARSNPMLCGSNGNLFEQSKLLIIERCEEFKPKKEVVSTDQDF
jgi:hypothetical protein